MSRPKRDRLGRGLGALLGDYPEEALGEGEIHRLPLEAVAPNPFQPREEFSESELEELARSIDENGLLQPLVVRPEPGREKERFQLVAGERRLRAVRRLEWKTVPVVVRPVDDRTLLVLALVENLQREALGPLEEAEGYRVLAEEFGLTQAEIADSVGKNRSTVANTLRLLNLPPSVRRMVEEGTLTSGHARALLGLEDSGRISEMARRAVAADWTVREVERRVRKAGSGPSSPGGDSPGQGRPSAADPVLRALQEELRSTLQTRVKIRRKGEEGVIEVPFQGEEDFERIFALVAGKEASEVVG